MANGDKQHEAFSSGHLTRMSCPKKGQMETFKFLDCFLSIAWDHMSRKLLLQPQSSELLFLFTEGNGK